MRLFRRLGQLDAEMSGEPECQDLPQQAEVARGVAQLRAELASAQMLASQSDAKASGLEAELEAMRSRQFTENASAQELVSRFEAKATGLEAELASADSMEYSSWSWIDNPRRSEKSRGSKTSRIAYFVAQPYSDPLRFSSFHSVFLPPSDYGL